MVYDFVRGGAADEKTVRRNCAAFDEIKLWPRVLRDVAHVDTRIELLGQPLVSPILLAPTGYHLMIHPEGELATARGATLAETPLVVSSSATMAIEEIAPELGGPFWFQFYLQPDRGVNREIIGRAEAAGCAALCLTVDTPSLGVRNREQRAGFTIPPHLSTPMNPLTETRRRSGSSGGTVGSWQRYPPVWRDLDPLLKEAKTPLVLKGILHPSDAKQAVEMGVSAIIVSNHGARNLDSGLATIEALARIVDAVEGRVPVLLDGGVRRGTDIVKALASGATAVLIGRPYLYGLAVDGAEGIFRVVQILRTELEIAMALVGCASIPALDRALFF